MRVRPVPVLSRVDRAARRRLRRVRAAARSALARTQVWWRHRPERLLLRAETGMSTAEYAVGTVAAVSFAAVLIAVVRSDAVRSALTSIITNALQVG